MTKTASAREGTSTRTFIVDSSSSPATASYGWMEVAARRFRDDEGATCQALLETNGPSFRTHVVHLVPGKPRAEGAWAWYPDRERGTDGLNELAAGLAAAGWEEESDASAQDA